MLRALHLISWSSLADALAASADRLRANESIIYTYTRRNIRSEQCSYFKGIYTGNYLLGLFVSTLKFFFVCRGGHLAMGETNLRPWQTCFRGFKVTFVCFFNSLPTKTFFASSASDLLTRSIASSIMIQLLQWK